VSISAKNDVIRQQRRWAHASGRRVDAGGFLARLDDNLRRPAAAGTLAAFDRAGSSEVQPRRLRPPRILALHSSAALVINVFEHWCERDPAPLLAALGIDGTCRKLAFEQPFATGLAGDPPYIDVAIELQSGKVIALESKFTEWLTPRPPNRARLKTKYFAHAARHWADRGLPAAQALAEDLQAGRQRFKYLHAAQLLKHALGLACGSGAVALYYLYYDVPGAQAKTHRAEIDGFRSRVTPEIEFTSLAYQDLFVRLCDDARVDHAYLEYLRARYFSRLPARLP
jgi:hypothetical protein